MGCWFGADSMERWWWWRCGWGHQFHGTNCRVGGGNVGDLLSIWSGSPYPERRVDVVEEWQGLSERAGECMWSVGGGE